MLQPATLADLPAFLCAHAEDARAGTGCTVFIAPDGATCGVDVRGGGPATRETDLLKPENMIQAVHGVVLSGGSAFGLAAATGVMDELAARGIGFPVESARVPIVVGACLFDLLVGQKRRESIRAEADGITFDAFWEKYHEITRKPKTNIGRARREWKKLSVNERCLSLNHIDAYYDNLTDIKSRMPSSA